MEVYSISARNKKYTGENQTRIAITRLYPYFNSDNHARSLGLTF